MSKPLRYALVIGTFLAAFTVGFVVLGWFFVCRGNACPSIDALDKYRPRQTSKLYAADGRFVAELGLERRTLVPIEQIPKVLRTAFIITEDRRFYEHSGIDVVGVFRAGFANLRRGGFAQGFSTITMQLARNVFPQQLTREKSPLRKLREARVARAIESKYSKDRIL